LRYLNRDHIVFGVILAVVIVVLTIGRYLGSL
jgi:hypothetical protein